MGYYKKYQKESVHVTRNIDRYVFKTEIVPKDIYAKLPFYCGVPLWNSLPMEYQNYVQVLRFIIYSCV